MAKDLDKPKADKTAQFRAEVAFRIKQAREDAGLTQRELAQRAGISQQQVSYAESGAKLLRATVTIELHLMEYFVLASQEIRQFQRRCKGLHVCVFLILFIPK